MRYHPQPKKTATEAHRRPEPPPLRRRARPLCARRLVRLPVRLALRCSERWAGVFRVRRPCPRPAPRARRSRLRRPRCFCGSMVRPALMAGEWAANNRALVPPGLRRRRPPRRRAAVRWRGRAVSGARGDGAAAPAPAGRLSVVGLVGLAAGRALFRVRVTGCRVAFASCRRGRGAPPAACSADGRSVWRGVGQSWAVHFAGACPPSPRRAPPSGSHPSGNFSGGRGARSRAPRLRRGRLRAGRAPLHPRCLCGLPPGLWPCALRLPRRVRPPAPARGGCPRRLAGRLRQ